MDETLILDTSRFQIRTHRFASICLMGAWPGCEPALSKHLRSQLQVDLPPDGQRAVPYSTGALYRVQPHKVLVTSGDDPKLPNTLRSGFSNDTGTLSDQSHGWLGIGIEGEALWPVLRQCLPLDPEHTLSAPGLFLQTRMGDANVLIHRIAELEATVLAPTSFAQAVVDKMIRSFCNIII